MIRKECADSEFSVHVDVKRQCVFAKHSGIITYENSLKREEFVRSHPDFDLSFNRCTDFTNCEINIHSTDLEKFSSDMKSRNVGISRQGYKVACLIDNKLIHGFLRQHYMRLNNENIKVELFDFSVIGKHNETMRRLKEWLELDHKFSIPFRE